MEALQETLFWLSQDDSRDTISQARAELANGESDRRADPGAVRRSQALRVSYEVVFAPTARREMSAVPERVIPAIIGFVYGDLAANARRVGNP